MPDIDPLDTITQTADAKFSVMTQSAIQAGVDAERALAGLMYDQAAWSSAAGTAEAKINDLLDNPEHQWMRPEEKQARIDQAKAEYNAAHEDMARLVQNRLNVLESLAHVAAESDLELAPSADRALIRSDIERAIANRKGNTVAETLRQLAASNPKKYAGELVKDDFGRQLVKNAGERTADSLTRDIIALTPGSTPKSQAARALLRAMPQAVGSVAGLKYAHAGRVERASKPRQPAAGFRPDTLIPRR